MTPRFALVNSNTGTVLFIGTKQDMDDYIYLNGDEDCGVYKILGGFMTGNQIRLDVKYSAYGD